MELSPVLEHLFELGVSVSESLHLGFISGELSFVFFQLPVGLLDVLQVVPVYLLQLRQLSLVVLRHALRAFKLGHSRRKFEVGVLNV